MRRSPLLSVVAAALLMPAPAWAEALSLDEALAMALKRNPTMATQQNQVELANIDYWRSQFQRATLTVDANGGDTNTTSGITTQAPDNQNTLSINGNSKLVIPIFTGWRITGGVERAEAAVSEQLAALINTRQNLAMQVIQAYWEYQRQLRLAKVNQDQVRQSQEIFDLAQTRLKVGAIAPIDVNRAEVSLISAQTSLIRSESALKNARAKLANLLYPDDDTWTLKDEPHYEPLEARTLADWTDEALANRPDVQVALARLKERQAEAVVARSRLWPEFDLSAQFQYGNNPYRPLGNSNNVLNTFQGTLDTRAIVTYTLFDNAESWRKIQEADLAVTSAELNLKQVRQQVAADVRSAYAAVLSAESQQMPVKRSIEIAQSNRDIMAMRYKLGAAAITDVNDVQRALVSALTDNLQAAIDHLNAVAQLYQAVGRPLIPAAKEAP